MLAFFGLLLWCVLGVNNNSIKIITSNKIIKISYFLIGVAFFFWVLTNFGNWLVDSIIVIGVAATIIKLKYFN